MIFIAEVKTCSPFGYKSNKSWDELFEIANNVGDWISIHTDSKWGGSFDLLNKARKLTNKIILAKGIHETDDEIKDCFRLGANFVLSVGRIPDLISMGGSYWLNRVIIEPKNLEQLKSIPDHFGVCWNSRDIYTGKRKEESFGQARMMFPGFLIQASNIKSMNDVRKNFADAFLVGEHLENFAN